MKHINLRVLCALAALCLLLGVLAALPVMADETPRLSLDKTEYEVGDPILVTAYGEGTDWVALYAASDVVEANSGYAAAYWYYVADNGHTSGETFDLQFADHIDAAARPELVGIPAGEYQVVLHSNNTYDIIERIYFTVKEPETEPATEAPETEPVTEPETEPETVAETEPESETVAVTDPESETEPVETPAETLDEKPDAVDTDPEEETPAESAPAVSEAPSETEPAEADTGCASVVGAGSALLLLAAVWVVSKKH